MNFGERLIKVRKEHGYTREALAQSLNDIMDDNDF